MVKRKFSSRKFIMVASDAMMTILAQWLALLLHQESAQAYYWRAFLSSAAVFAGSALIIFPILGFYDHIWRFASVKQYLALLWGSLVQTAGIYVFMTLRGDAYSAELYIIYLMIVFLLVTGTRVAYRAGMNNPVFRAIMYRRLSSLVESRKKGDDVRKKASRLRVIIVGAGVTGSQLVREMKMGDLYDPVAMIDDNPLTHAYKILGVPVYGDRYSIPEAVNHYHADLILLAVPSAPKESIRGLVNMCSKTGCELKMIPFLHHLIDGQVTIEDIRDVEIEDLLGRDEVVLDTSAIAGFLKDEVVLVTGGGGSIGSELCRQIARFRPRQLIIFDIHEDNALWLKNQLEAYHGTSTEWVVRIGSVRDISSLERIFSQYHPGVVFHAAAHKHVPLMEDSPGEAVKNNILGTYHVAHLSAQFQAKRFVLISTDKAVNPANVMGATKRVAEMIIQSLSAQYPSTRFAAVRFGNVLGSSGSVIPIFKQQIARERRVTVTHPDITRYFMTIPEAARLVIQAGAMASGGEIFVLDMGEPMKILDLATDLIRLSGLEPGVDVTIDFTGLRPGEKMYEELFLDKETMGRTRHEKIFTVMPVHNQWALIQELDHLNRIIRWQNDESDQLMDWLRDHFPSGGQK